MSSGSTDDRLLRTRRADRAAFASGLDRPEPAGVNRQLVRVYSGGSFPATTGRVFLTHPASVDFDEVEGATPTYADGEPTLPVVFIGSAPPNVGDLFVAAAVGGRWVADFTPAPAVCVACEPCCIPARNLTASWGKYGQVADGSALLTWDGASTWDSGCAGPLRMTLACVGGSIVFSVTYYPDGGCPDGSSTTCVSGVGLTLVQVLCTPFLLTYSATLASCPDLAAAGYTQFTITH